MIWLIILILVRMSPIVHHIRNLYVPLLREMVCEHFLSCHWIPLSVITNLLPVHCQVNSRTHFAAFLFYTNTTSWHLADYL